MTHARNYADTKHKEKNSLYDGKPYIYHLDMSQRVFKLFEYMVPTEDHTTIYIAIYLHDIMEECNVGYPEIRDNFGNQVAEIVYAVTEEKGRFRADRQSATYYQGIRACKYATFVKLCDRIANVLYSKETENHKKFRMYMLDFDSFKTQLYTPEYKEMFDYLENLFV